MDIILFENCIDTELLYFVLYVIYYPKYHGNPKKHFDEEKDSMFNDNFIAGINTPDGIVTYQN